MHELPAPRCFPARLDALADVLAYVADACRRAGTDADTRMRAELAVEELFTNTVHHGYRGGDGQPVWIAAGGEAGRLFVSYRDIAPAFDPLAPPSRPTDPQRVGGRGLGLIAGLADAADYRREDDGNCLELRFGPRLS